MMPLLSALILASCENKELCFEHDQHIPRYATRVHADYELIWEQSEDNQTHWQSVWPSLGLGMSYNALRPSVPEGIRMMAFNVDGTRTQTNMPSSGDEIYLPPGDNSLLFYNNDTEFIVFNDMGSYTSASATTRSRYRSSYTGNPLYSPPRGSDGKSGETTVSAPDVLFGHYIDRYFQKQNTSPQQLDITMHPLVFTYVICCRFKSGYEHVALARGALAGMAQSVYLHDGHTSPESVTILYDCTLEPWGVLAEVKSFGIPDYPNSSYSRSTGDFAVTLEMKLKSGKIVNNYFNITEQMSRQPHGGVIAIDDIVVTDDSSGSGSAFDVTVDDWGEFEDVPIDF